MDCENTKNSSCEESNSSKTTEIESRNINLFTDHLSKKMDESEKIMIWKMNQIISRMDRR